jgi:hypothetical protein
VDVWSEVLKNIWMKTYMAGAHTTSGRCAEFGGHDDTAINLSTCCVGDDCEISIPKSWTNAVGAWECNKELGHIQYWELKITLNVR